MKPASLRVELARPLTLHTDPNPHPRSRRTPKESEDRPEGVNPGQKVKSRSLPLRNHISTLPSISSASPSPESYPAHALRSSIASHRTRDKHKHVRTTVIYYVNGVFIGALTPRRGVRNGADRTLQASELSWRFPSTPCIENGNRLWYLSL